MLHIYAHSEFLKNSGVDIDMDTEFFENRGVDMDTAWNRCPPNSGLEHVIFCAGLQRFIYFVNGRPKRKTLRYAIKWAIK